MFPGGKCGRCVGLTTLPPSCADCLEFLAASTSCSPKGLSSPAMGLLYIHITSNCIPINILSERQSRVAWYACNLFWRSEVPFSAHRPNITADVSCYLSSPSMQMLKWCTTIDHGHLIPHPFELIVHKTLPFHALQPTEIKMIYHIH